MRTFTFAAALVLSAALLCACGGDTGPAPAPTPAMDPLAALREQVGAIADAEITEEDGALSIVILLEETDVKAACEQFFDQAAQIYTQCLSDTEYTGIGFSLSVNGKIAGVLYLIPDDGGLQMMEPVSLSEEYNETLVDAFYNSAFGRSFQY